MTSGPALDKKMDVMPYLTNAVEGSILFIDEIHRLPKTVEEFIYPVMEDFRVDVVLGEGMTARTINLPLEEVHDHRRHDPQRHALRAAARPVPPPRAPGVLRRRGPRPDRRRSTPSKLRTTITPEAAWELARRSRGTPRLANARLRWVRDFATARADGQITLAIAQRRAGHAGGRRRGDGQAGPPLPGDARSSVFRGGPTGAEALAATMSLAVDTLTDEVEPYLLRREFIVRTPAVARPRRWPTSCWGCRCPSR